jgi:hypothetical protein
MKKECQRGEKLAPKRGDVNRLYFGGQWTWRCECGGIATAKKMGWVDGKFGLVVNRHQQGGK